VFKVFLNNIEGFFLVTLGLLCFSSFALKTVTGFAIAIIPKETQISSLLLFFIIHVVMLVCWKLQNTHS
jgi:hypothetical protein